MDKEVQDFITAWENKSTSKALALEAIGEAKIAELRGEDATSLWQLADSKGRAEGDEGRYYDEAFSIAEAYVNGHPEVFSSFERLVNPDDHEILVTLINTFREHGREEEATQLTMFELVRFERQQIGGALRAVVRPRNGNRS